MKRKVTILSGIIVAALALAACSPAALSTLGKAQASLNNQLAQATSPTAALTAVPASPAANPVTGSSLSTSGEIAALEGTFEQIYNQVGPSVVNIQVVSTGSSQQQQNNSPFPFGFGNQGQNSAPVQQALGSGFVWDTQGDIVTNNHVIDGATTISVTFSDGFTVPATLVARDVNSDLAVVKVSVSADRLHPVTLADSNGLKVGEMAIAIGNPFGLSGTMTTGIISAIGRSLPVNQNATTGSYTIPNIIQTDAPINPGNSGGVLLNNQGQVIGVTNAIESSSGSNSGIGFAIPSAIVQKVVPALIQKGGYTYSWMGVSGTSLTYDLNQAMNLKTDQRGALVVDVTANGPAAQAGLKGSTQQTTVNGDTVPVGGDIITAINGQAVNTFDDVVSYLVMNTQPGQKVTLTVLRNGSQQQVDVTLGTRPSNTGSALGNIPNNNGNNNGNGNNGNGNNGNNNGNNGNNNTPAPTRGVRLGITGLDLSAELDQAAGLNNNQQGVLVEQVQPGSAAEQAGLKGSTQTVTVGGQQVNVGGDVIVALDGKAVTSVQDLQGLLQQYQSGQTATLSILRNGSQMDVKVTFSNGAALVP